MRPIVRRTLRLLLGGLALIAVGFVVLPTGRYLLRGAWEESRILLRRRSIAALVADTSVPPDTRARLRLVLDARRFAVEQLGLRARKSFSTYAKVDHDTLVLVLTAAFRDRLEPLRWWFPIVGDVPYKGFFNFALARRTRDQLEQRGFDTSLGASSAFSTLGWFNDPLLSTTLRGDTLDLSSTVIHELTHNTLFVSSQVEFNESFASFVGARGAAAFFRSRGGERAAERVEEEWADDKLLSSFWKMLSHAVDSAYAEWPSDSAARVRARDSVFAHARRVLTEDLAPVVKTIPRANLERMRLNNAVLLARRAYARDLWVFDEVFRASGNDIRRSIQQIVALTQDATDPFEAMRSWLGGKKILP